MSTVHEHCSRGFKKKEIKSFKIKFSKIKLFDVDYDLIK